MGNLPKAIGPDNCRDELHDLESWGVVGAFLDTRLEAALSSYSCNIVTSAYTSGRICRLIMQKNSAIVHKMHASADTQKSRWLRLGTAEEGDSDAPERPVVARRVSNGSWGPTNQEKRFFVNFRER